ncbi:MAG: hypothetical protein ACQEP8_05610 [Chlamydiota bacterium]
MFEQEIFIGYHVDKECQKAFDKVNPYVLKTFINNGDNYLKEHFFQGKRYLGKKSTAIANLKDLYLLENNIYSLLKKIANEYPFNEQPLVLLAINKSSS